MTDNDSAAEQTPETRGRHRLDSRMKRRRVLIGGVVVLTSAFGAIGYGHPPRSTPYTEEDWTNVDADIAPFQRSKTPAERAAWRFIEDEGDGLELAAVHPVAVLGPVLGPDDPPSLRLIRGMLAGDLAICPPFGSSWVDVRDVADCTCAP
ncbi:hypothetical protein [Streptomyces aureus]|uniref:hypothetical protein n=1 Tax=Streptomyces aureus TaxID=193461 RepID=UPI00369472EE